VFSRVCAADAESFTVVDILISASAQSSSPTFTSSQFLAYIIISSIGFFVLANAFCFLCYVRRLQFSTNRDIRKISWVCWSVITLLTGPLVWILWYVYSKSQVNDSSMKSPLLSDDSLICNPHISLSMAHSIIQSSGIVQVRSNDVKIHAHVPEQRGGGGIVNQATWNGRIVAVKRPFFNSDMSEHDKKKFVKELEFQAKLRHPNCVGVFAVCTETQNVFIVMEWMHGGSLFSQLIKTRQELATKQSGTAGSGTTLTARTRLSIAREICDGLQYMHSNGMIHGDIKSLNVLLDKDKSAKLCDFGLTTMQLSSTTTKSSNTGGTFAWSAPEIVLSGSRLSYQTDVYALGVVLWELLTCMQPYEGLKVPQIYGLLNAKQRPPIPNPLPDGFTDAYVDIIMRCWSDDPLQRPSASEVHQCMIALDTNTQVNEPVVLYPKGRKWLTGKGVGETSILPCLARALPDPCCRLMLQSIVTEAEKHVTSQSVTRLIASYKLHTLEAQSIFVYTVSDTDATKSIVICSPHAAPFKTYNSV
jgi:serine/threonine protein kinase